MERTLVFDVSSGSRTIRLGDEYDQRLRRALAEALQDMRGLPGEKSFGVGGSQEVDRMEVAIAGRRVTIEAETYMGLSVTGEEAIVEELARRVGERMSAR